MPPPITVRMVRSYLGRVQSACPWVPMRPASRHIILWSRSPGATIGRWGWGGGWTTRAWSLTCNRLTGYWWHIFQKENPVKYAKNWSNKYRLVITIIEVLIVPLVSRLLPPLSPLPPREVFLFFLPSFPNFNSHLSYQNGGLRRVWEHRFSC